MRNREKKQSTELRFNIMQNAVNKVITNFYSRDCDQNYNIEFKSIPNVMMMRYLTQTKGYKQFCTTNENIYHYRTSRALRELHVVPSEPFT